MQECGDNETWQLRCWVCAAAQRSFQVSRVLLPNLRRRDRSQQHQQSLLDCGLSDGCIDDQSAPTAEEFKTVLSERLKKQALDRGVPGVGGQENHGHARLTLDLSWQC